MICWPTTTTQVRKMGLFFFRFLSKTLSTYEGCSISSLNFALKSTYKYFPFKLCIIWNKLNSSMPQKIPLIVHKAKIAIMLFHFGIALNIDTYMYMYCAFSRCDQSPGSDHPTLSKVSLYNVQRSIRQANNTWNFRTVCCQIWRRTFTRRRRHPS